MEEAAEASSEPASEQLMAATAAAEAATPPSAGLSEDASLPLLLRTDSRLDIAEEPQELSSLKNLELEEGGGFSLTFFLDSPSTAFGIISDILCLASAPRLTISPPLFGGTGGRCCCCWLFL